MIRIEGSGYCLEIEVSMNSQLDLSLDYIIDINRQQAAQLAEVLKRYAETGRLEE